jgi:hypothetical protein
MSVIESNSYNYTMQGVGLDANIVCIEPPGEAGSLGPVFMAEEGFVARLLATN